MDTHDADRGAKRMRRDIVPELRLDDAGVAVRAGDAPPDDAHLGAVDLALCAVDERNALA